MIVEDYVKASLKTQRGVLSIIFIVVAAKIVVLSAY